MGQNTAGRPPLSQPPKTLMTIRSSCGFSHFRPRVFLIFYGHTKLTYTTERAEEKRTNKHGLGLAPSARRKKFVTLSGSFQCICGLARAWVRARFPQGHLERWLILSRSADCPVLPNSVLSTGFFCYALFCPALGPCLPSSSSGRMGDLVCKHFVWVSRQNRQRDPLIGTHTHTNRNGCPPPIVSQVKRCTSRMITQIHIQQESRRKNIRFWLVCSTLSTIFTRPCTNWFPSFPFFAKCSEGLKDIEETFSGNLLVPENSWLFLERNQQSTW